MIATIINQVLYAYRGDNKKTAPSHSSTSSHDDSAVDSSAGPSNDAVPSTCNIEETTASVATTATSGASQLTPSFTERFDIGLKDIDKLTDHDRRGILDNKWKPPTGYPFPKNSQNRHYSITWEEKYTWLRYSPSVNGVFCAACVCFAPPQTLKNQEFVSKPFKDWKNACGTKRGALPAHNASDIHQAAMRTTEDFLAICNAEKKSINEHLSQAYHDKVEMNRKALMSILDVIISLSTRGIPLRGRWLKESHEEDSNFNFFVKWKSVDNTALATHMEKCPRNAQYLSPKVQNELLDCFAGVVQSDIISRAMESDFFSIMADETTDQSKIEQLSICIRYLHRNQNDNLEVAEDFIGFVELPETGAAAITEALITQLTTWKVDMEKWRGKGFDGAAAMSGHLSGVTTRIREAFPKAKYFTHCR